MKIFCLFTCPIHSTLFLFSFATKVTETSLSSGLTTPTLSGQTTVSWMTLHYSLAISADLRWQWQQTKTMMVM